MGVKPQLQFSHSREGGNPERLATRQSRNWRLQECRNSACAILSKTNTLATLVMYPLHV